VTTIHLGPLITTDLTLPVTDLNLDVAEEHRVKSDTMAIKFSLNPKRHLSGKMTNTVFMTYDLGSSGLDFYECMEDNPDCFVGTSVSFQSSPLWNVLTILFLTSLVPQDNDLIYIPSFICKLFEEFYL
jgi:hypothetical protein